MKKSVLECMGRRRACREGIRSILQFLGGVPAYRRPTTTIPEFIQHGAGARGAFVSFNKSNLEITSAALLSEPAMNKETFMLSALFSAMISFRDTVPTFGIQDGVGIVVLLKVLNNLEVLVQVLRSGELERHWSGRWNHVGGLPGLIVSLINARTGGINISGGKIRRCQAFSNKTTRIQGKYFTDLVEAGVSASIRSWQNNWSSASPAKLAAAYEDCCMLLGRVTPSGTKTKAPKESAWSLSNQTCVKMLFMTGIVKPLECVQFARVPPQNTNQKKRKNQAMDDFVAASSDTQLTATEKFQDCVRTYLNQAYEDYGFPHAFAETIMENTTCEVSRSPSFGARDLLFPWQLLVQYVPSEDGRPACLQMYRGTYNEQTKAFGIVYAGLFQGLRFTDYGLFDTQVPQGELTLKLVCEISDQSGAQLGREEQMELSEANIGVVALNEIKILCMQPIQTTRQYGQLLKRIGKIPEVRDVLCGRKARQRRVAPALVESRKQSAEWNCREDPIATKVLEKLPPKLITSSTVPGPPVAALPKVSPPENSGKRKSRWSTPTREVKRSVGWSEVDEVFPLFPFQGGVPVFDVETSKTQREMPKLGFTVFDVDNKTTEKQYFAANSGPVSFQDPMVSRPPALVEATRKEGRNPDIGEPIPYIYNVESESLELSDEQIGNLLVGPGQASSPRPKQRPNLPTVTVDGVQYELDWSAKNLEAIGYIQNRGIMRRMFPTLNSKFHFAGRDFAGICGTRDLQNVCAASRFVPNLLDFARNAINSVDPKGSTALPGQDKNIRGQLTLVDLPCSNVLVPETNKRLYFCQCERTSNLVFSIAGECEVCDDIALQMGGERYHDSTKFWWGFGDEDTARDYYLLAAFLTCGSEAFYISVHNNARRAYRGCVQQAQSLQLGRATRPRDALPPNRFVVAYRRNDKSCPFFFVIGNLGIDERGDWKTGHFMLPKLKNDFSIAIPTRSQWDSNNRKSSRRDPGRALFVRPLHSKRCLHVSSRGPKEGPATGHPPEA